MGFVKIIKKKCFTGHLLAAASGSKLHKRMVRRISAKLKLVFFLVKLVIFYWIIYTNRLNVDSQSAVFI